MNNVDRKSQADRILYEFGLLKKLEELGVPHIIGSYRMDMMAWYEAKEEINEEGKLVWFHGFETMITGELWNIDLWFFDRETITNAESYSDEIAQRTSQIQKDRIIQIKEELIARDLYSFEKYKSLDVYKAVLENDVVDVEGFLKLYA